MDQNLLNGKTQEELVTICSEREITGMSNQPKDVLITVLLNDMADNDGIPTRSALELLSPTELRERLADLDITGLEVQPKPVLIDILLNAHVKAVLSGVQATVVVTKATDGKITSKVTVSCGGSQNDFEVSGHSVGEVSELLREVLNIPDTPIAVVNGNTVDCDYVLQDGDILDFVQKAEKKG